MRQVGVETPKPPSTLAARKAFNIAVGLFVRLLAWAASFVLVIHYKTKNVTTNDVLPLKAAQRDAIANWKCSWGPRQQRPNFDGFIYIHYTAPPYLARISAIHILPFGKVWLCSVCRMQRVATKQNAELLRSVDENSGLIFTRLWTEVHGIFRRCRRPLVLSNALARLSVSFHSEDIRY